jgi:hypothetical protein
MEQSFNESTGIITITVNGKTMKEMEYNLTEIYHEVGSSRVYLSTLPAWPNDVPVFDLYTLLDVLGYDTCGGLEDNESVTVEYCIW